MIDKNQLDKLKQRGVDPVIAVRFSVFQNCPNHFSTFSPSNLPILLQCGHFMCQQCQQTEKKCAVCRKDIKIKQRNFKFFFQVMQTTNSPSISEKPEAKDSKMMQQVQLNISEGGQINGIIDQNYVKIIAAKQEQSLKIISNNQNHFQLLKEVQIGMGYCANVQTLFKMKNGIPTYHTRQVYFKLKIQEQEKYLQVINQMQYFYYAGPYKIEPGQPCELVVHIVYFVQQKLKEDGIMTCNDSPAFVRLDNFHKQNSFAPEMMAWIDLRKKFEDIIKKQNQLFQQNLDSSPKKDLDSSQKLQIYQSKIKAAKFQQQKNPKYQQIRKIRQKPNANKNTSDNKLLKQRKKYELIKKS